MRGAGAGAGGREVHLCKEPSGLLLPWFREVKHLQMCSGGREGRRSRRSSIGTQYTGR